MMKVDNKMPTVIKTEINNTIEISSKYNSLFRELLLRCRSNNIFNHRKHCMLVIIKNNFLDTYLCEILKKLVLEQNSNNYKKIEILKAEIYKIWEIIETEIFYGIDNHTICTSHIRYHITDKNTDKEFVRNYMIIAIMSFSNKEILQSYFLYLYNSNNLPFNFTEKEGKIKATFKDPIKIMTQNEKEILEDSCIEFLNTKKDQDNWQEINEEKINENWENI